MARSLGNIEGVHRMARSGRHGCTTLLLHVEISKQCSLAAVLLIAERRVGEPINAYYLHVDLIGLQIGFLPLQKT